MKIDTSTTKFGAVVTEFDMHNATRNETDDLYDAFLKHGLIIFKGMDIDEAEHLKLSAIFGEPDIHPIEAIRHSEEPHLIVIAANGGRTVSPDDPDADTIIGRITWHVDLIYTAAPNRGGMLRAITVPQGSGQTGWIDSVALYKALPTEVKARIQGLHVIHSYSHGQRGQTLFAGRGDQFPDVIHPLVYVHPESDLPVLNIGPSTARKIVGLPEAEADELLAYLLAFAADEERAYIHSWEPGDVIIWDNWRTMHRTYGHAKKHRRVMHRTTLKARLKLGELLDASAQAA